MKDDWHIDFYYTGANGNVFADIAAVSEGERNISGDFGRIFSIEIYKTEKAEEIANIVAAAQDGLEVAKNAYLALLKMAPDNPFRIVNQPLYAAMRDYIAAATDRTPEQIQKEYERIASL